MNTPKNPTTPKNNVINFAAVKSANRLAGSDLGDSLREIADLTDKAQVRNLFMAWTMADGSLHYGHGSLADAVEHWEDDHLRLLGLLRLAERGFTDALVLDTKD